MIEIIASIVGILITIIITNRWVEKENYPKENRCDVICIVIMYCILTTICLSFFFGISSGYTKQNTDAVLVDSGIIEAVDTDNMSGAERIRLKDENRYYNENKINSDTIYIINAKEISGFSYKNIINVKRDGEPTYEVYKRVPRKDYWSATIFPMFKLPKYTTIIAYTPTGETYINYQ